MQPMNQQKPDTKTEARYRILLVIWFAILTSVGMFFFLTMFIPRPQAAENNILSFTLGAMGGFLAVVSFVPKQKLLAQAAEKQQPQFVNTAYIIAFALTEASALFGLLMYMVTPERFYFLLFIIAVIFMLVHFPRREHLVAAVFKNQR